MMKKEDVEPAVAPGAKPASLPHQIHRQGLAGRDVVVIGASSGGLEAVCILLKGLPVNLPAALFVVQHTGAVSRLAEVFGRCTVLPVSDAVDNAAIVPGQVYIAPGDRHLLIRNGHVGLSKSPRENRHRPSVDALFRSAARVCGSRVIAVVLSGFLDDGAAGALAVKSRGGLLIVQDPEEAACPDMPRNAMRAAKADYCLPLVEIAPLIVKLVRETSAGKDGRRSSGQKGPVARPRAGSAADFTCPECGGPLYARGTGPSTQFECLVGHSFSPESLSQSHKDALERSLLSAMRMLKERAAIHQNLARHEGGGRSKMLRQRFLESADAAARDIVLLREILERL